MKDISGLIFTLLAIALISLPLSWLARWLSKNFPYRPVNNSENLIRLNDLKKRFDELNAKYAKWDYILLTIFLISTLLFSFIVYKIFPYFALYLIPATPPNIYLMLPHQSVYLNIALFAGICMSIFIVYLLPGIIFKEEYFEYNMLNILIKHEMDYKKVKSVISERRYMPPVYIILCIILSYAGMDYYTRFTDKEITVNVLLTISEISKPYDQITHIKFIKNSKSPKGAIYNNPRYIIQFNDGRSWTTEQWFAVGNGYPAFLNRKTSLQIEKEKEIMQFVSSKSKKEIETYELPSDQ